MERDDRMSAVLLRAPKDPFSVRSRDETVERDLIGGNSGNLLFLTAAHKLLSVPGRTIEPDRFRYRTRDAGAINERYEAYAIPLANAFRPQFESILARMTDLITRLRIPVVVLGVGAQAELSGDWSRLAPMQKTVKAFVRAVLDRGPSIGVRGEITADYLKSLGFRDVEVIGCPSMFLWGDRLGVEKGSSALPRDARLSITVSPYLAAMGPILMHHVARYPNLIYVAQDRATLEKLVWGEPAGEASRTELVPVHLSHPVFRQGLVRFYVDPWPWISDLRGIDFSFGSRIHGSIAALLAGTPAVVLAHDSRTLELARYFNIPHRPLVDTPSDVDAAGLYEAADFGPLNAGHAARFRTFVEYMARHGLDNVFAHAGAASAWDARADATPYPPAVRASPDGRAEVGPGEGHRLLWSLYRRARLSARAVVRRRS